MNRYALMKFKLLCKFAVVCMIISGVLTGCGAEATPTPTIAPTATPLEKNKDDGAKMSKQYDSAPAMAIDSSKSYTAVFKTEKGDIGIKLFAAQVPNTVNNFIFLSREGFYDETTFHRVIPNFMAQGGDPTGSGMGGPGYRFNDEFHPDLRHDKAGILSMANAGPNTNGSQFFITHGPTPHLDNRHAVFGEVIEGIDVLMSISVRDPQTAANSGDKIHTIEIIEN